MTDMAKIRFKGYVPERLPSGEIRHRVRVEGNPKRRIRITVGPDHPEFSEHYHAARAGQTVQENARPVVAAGTLDADVRRYLDMLETQATAGIRSPLTFKQRRSLLTQACDFLAPDGRTRMGALVSPLPRSALVHIRDAWGVRTAQADNCIKAFRAVYSELESNPASGIKSVHTSQGGATAWTMADVRRFMDHHPRGTSARMWLMLALFSTARIGDLAKLGRCHEIQRAGVTWLEWQPGKKGSAFVSLPLAPQVIEEARAQTVIGASYILNAHGRPFRSSAALGMRVQRWTAEAGLTNRSSHGVRKGAGGWLAEHGATQHQIMAVMSHSSPKTSEIYTRSAARSRLAADAMQAISGIRL